MKWAPPIAAVLVVGTLLAPPARADTPIEALASVDRTKVALGQRLTYTLRLTASKNVTMSFAERPKFGSFQVLGSQNGQEIRSDPSGVRVIQTVSVTLRARAMGRQTIKAPTVLVGKKKVTANDVTVEVVEKGAQVAEVDDSPVRFRVVADEMKPFVGEQVILEYAVYADPRKVGPFGSDIRDVTEPAFDGLWIEDLSKSLNRMGRREILDGRQFQVQPVRLLAVFPLSSGKLEIEAMNAEVSFSRVLSRRHSKVTTGPLVLDVQPLPAGAPTGFDSGNVGQYSLDVRTDKRRVAVGEPLTLTIEVKGIGMVGRTELPILEELDGFHVLEPVFDKEIKRDGRRLRGSKTAAIVLTPERTGVFEIPALTFHAFDPDLEEYVTRTSKPISVAVAGKWVNQETEVDVADRAEVDVPEALLTARKELGTIRTVTDLGSGRDRQPIYTHPLFILALVVPPFGYSAFVLWARLRRRRQETAPARRMKKASAVGTAALLKSAQQAASGDTTEAFTSAAVAMRQYLTDKLELVGTPSWAVLGRELEKRGVARELVAELQRWRKRCDEGRFGAGGDPVDAVEKAQRLLDELEAAL